MANCELCGRECTSRYYVAARPGGSPVTPKMCRDCWVKNTTVYDIQNTGEVCR